MEKREAAGEVVKKKRKELSDKGVPKGPKKKAGTSDDEEDGAEAGPSKKRKVDKAKRKKVDKGKGKAPAAKKAKSQLPPSNEFIYDSD